MSDNVTDASVAAAKKRKSTNSKPIGLDHILIGGGGQVIRNALSLSVLLKKNIRITNLRAEGSGLYTPSRIRKSDVAAVKFAAQMCNADFHGFSIESVQLNFDASKGDLKRGLGGVWNNLPPQESSLTSLIEVWVPCALFAHETVNLVLRGGTKVKDSPRIDEMQSVYGNMIREFGASFQLNIDKRDFSRSTGNAGQVDLKINPVRQLKATKRINRGEISHIWANLHLSSNISWTQADDIIESVRQAVFGSLQADIDKMVHFAVTVRTFDLEPLTDDEESHKYMRHLMLSAKTSTGCVLSASAYTSDPYEEAGKRFEESVAVDFIKVVKSGACVDDVMQDKYVIFMALAQGTSAIRCAELTERTKGAIRLAEKLTGAEFRIVSDADLATCIVECDGIGFTNKYIP